MSQIGNRVVLITGAASGIGRLMALEFGRRGARLVLWDIDWNGLVKTTEKLQAKGVEAHYYVCNVGDRDEIYRTADKVKAEVGQVHILVNNAGVVTGRAFLECSDEDIEKTMAVNTLAHFWTLKAFLPDMVRRNDGHIVTIASAAGILGVNRLSDYCASKFAAFGLDEALHMEFRDKNWNIRTTVVCPYFINTGMFRGVKTRFAFLLPLLDPEKVARKVVRAVIKDRRRLIMPITVYLVWMMRYLPSCWFDRAVTGLGINDAMKHFRGRRSP